MTRQGRPKTLCINRLWQEMTWIDCQKDLFCCLFCFVGNTTVMYRDNPLAFWSETANNSLNRYRYPSQTAKLNYKLLEFRSKTAGNCLFLITQEIFKFESRTSVIRQILWFCRHRWCSAQCANPQKCAKLTTSLTGNMYCIGSVQCCPNFVAA